MISYFDYNATHPPLSEIILEETKDYLENFYNPSGATRFSLKRQKRIEDAREFFATKTNKEKQKIVFSSTGTEANHILVSNIKNWERFQGKVYVSPFEHSSMYGALRKFKIEYEVLKSNEKGLIDLEYLEEKLNQEQAPIIIIYASNETGVIQEISKIGEIAKSFNVPLISDLMQAVGKIEVDYSYLDGFTFSGHKIGSGMGASLSYIGFVKKIDSIFSGGNQENGTRAGTENSLAITQFQKAFIFQESVLKEKNSKLISFRDSIEKFFEEKGAEVIGKNSNRLPNTSFLILPTEDVDFFMLGLEEREILISTGSSCKSRAREAPSSLLSMGYSKEKALKAIRISTGLFTTEDDVKNLLRSSGEILNALLR
ncbi:MAG: aminotransferase class V-fold PLP-dependent enzyme [Leptospiraceae bacterium]|nr:aminotransferase class V-fold PLP-dependent enzyme [Leptospiraceae bacterium]